MAYYIFLVSGEGACHTYDHPWSDRNISVPVTEPVLWSVSALLGLFLVLSVLGNIISIMAIMFGDGMQSKEWFTYKKWYSAMLNTHAAGIWNFKGYKNESSPPQKPEFKVGGIKNLLAAKFPLKITKTEITNLFRQRGS